MANTRAKIQSRLTQTKTHSHNRAQRHVVGGSEARVNTTPHSGLRSHNRKYHRSPPGNDPLTIPHNVYITDQEQASPPPPSRLLRPRFSIMPFEGHVRKAISHKSNWPEQDARPGMCRRGGGPETCQLEEG